MPTHQPDPRRHGHRLVAELIGHNDLKTTRLYTLTTEAPVARLPAGQLWIFSRHPSVADGSRCVHGPDRDHEGLPAAPAGHGVPQRGTRENLSNSGSSLYGWLGDSGLASIDAVGIGWQEPGRRDRGWYREGSWEA